MQVEFVLLNLGDSVNVQKGTLTIESGHGLDTQTVLDLLRQTVDVDMDDAIPLKTGISETLTRRPDSRLKFNVNIGRRGSAVATVIKLVR
ncbi:hypothetical protein KBC75_01885 [Candidatus Shapirobacteria bacterium]|nr:hypothetical protein [Candidatus Shapirobacteria bacterium]